MGNDSGRLEPFLTDGFFDETEFRCLICRFAASTVAVGPGSPKLVDSNTPVVGFLHWQPVLITAAYMSISEGLYSKRLHVGV